MISRTCAACCLILLVAVLCSHATSVSSTQLYGNARRLGELHDRGIGGCSSSTPCGQCEGDCDSDNDCVDALKCFSRNGHEKVPGCSGEGFGTWDYCYLPEGVSPEPAPSERGDPAPSNKPRLSEDQVCTRLNPCGLCGGDCDRDFHCEGDLVCFKRDGFVSVPGCSGNGLADWDYCVKAEPSSPSPPPTPHPTSRPTERPTTMPPVPEPTDPPDTPNPTPRPTERPTMPPVPEPTDPPDTPSPTNRPTQRPTTPPVPEPTDPPDTQNPTPRPTRRPTEAPTTTPTDLPETPPPTDPPTDRPTEQPTSRPTDRPTDQPTEPPTDPPTMSPTGSPINPPTNSPTLPPTNPPTNSPTLTPVVPPTEPPTDSPTPRPTDQPTQLPTNTPSKSPTSGPTDVPIGSPSPQPTSPTPPPAGTLPGLKWTVLVNSKARKGNSATFSRDGSMIYVTLTDGTVRALDSETGQTRWQYTPEIGINGWPVKCQSGVALGSSEDFGEFLVYAIIDEAPVEESESRVVALSHSDGQVLWVSSPHPGEIAGTPVVAQSELLADSYVFIVHNRADGESMGHFSVIAMTDGAEIFTEESGDNSTYAPLGVAHSPLFGNYAGGESNLNDIVVWTTSDRDGRSPTGYMRAFQLPTGFVPSMSNLLQTVELVDVPWSAVTRPTLGKDGLTLFSSVRFSQVQGWVEDEKFDDLPTWMAQLQTDDARLNEPIRNAATLSVDEERLFVSSAATSLAAIEANTGTLLWETASTSRFLTEARVPVQDDVVYAIQSADGRLICRDQMTGALVWSASCDSFEEDCANSVEAEFDISADGNVLVYVDVMGRVIALTVGAAPLPVPTSVPTSAAPVSSPPSAPFPTDNPSLSNPTNPPNDFNPGVGTPTNSHGVKAQVVTTTSLVAMLVGLVALFV